MSVTIRSKIPQFNRNMRLGASMVVRKTAFDLAAGASQRTPPRVDTGAMMGGWHVTQVSELESDVSNRQFYTIYNELGTKHMDEHPMVRPAAEAVFPAFVEGIRQVMERG